MRASLDVVSAPGIFSPCFELFLPEQEHSGWIHGGVFSSEAPPCCCGSTKLLFWGGKAASIRWDRHRSGLFDGLRAQLLWSVLQHSRNTGELDGGGGVVCCEGSCKMLLLKMALEKCKCERRGFQTSLKPSHCPEWFESRSSEEAGMGWEGKQT